MQLQFRFKLSHSSLLFAPHHEHNEKEKNGKIHTKTPQHLHAKRTSKNSFAAANEPDSDIVLKTVLSKLYQMIVYTRKE